MPVTVDKPGYWYDKELDAMMRMMEIANQVMPGSADISLPKGEPTIPGRIEQKSFPGIPVVPMSDPNKIQKDLQWIDLVLKSLEPDTFNYRGKMTKNPPRR